MKIVGTLGQILGPIGLMPNAKDGTLTNNIDNTIKLIKQSRLLRYRSDKSSIIHAKLGQVDIASDKICQNFDTLLQAIKKEKIKISKGTLFKKIFLSSTMGVGLRIQHSN